MQYGKGCGLRIGVKVAVSNLVHNGLLIVILFPSVIASKFRNCTLNHDQRLYITISSLMDSPKGDKRAITESALNLINITSKTS